MGVAYQSRDREDDVRRTQNERTIQESERKPANLRNESTSEGQRRGERSRQRKVGVDL